MITQAPASNRALWIDEFHAFSVTHAVTLGVLAAIVVGVCAHGLRMRDSASAVKSDRSVGSAGALAWLVVTVWWLSPSRFDPGLSLPLQLCDLAGLVAPIAIWTTNRPLRSLLHFWGIGLCTQGLLTPVASEGPGHAAFWMTWLIHGSIALLAVHDVVVRRFRPTWRDLAVALSITTLYALCMFAINTIFGWNYGYLGKPTPGSPTLLDALGPWPLRAVWVMLLGAGAMVTLMMFWEIGARLVPRKPFEPSSDRGSGD